MKKKLAIMSLVLIAVLALGNTVYAGPGGFPIDSKSAVITQPPLNKTVYPISERNQTP